MMRCCEGLARFPPVQLPLDFQISLAHAMVMSDVSDIVAAKAAFYTAFGAVRPTIAGQPG